jgi:hypothetical protein
MGKNIKIYDRIDGSIIFQMLETYSKQRSEAFSATFEKEHDFYKYQQEKERGQ